MKIETNSERVARLLREAERSGTIVPGRALPRGYQWVGYDIEGRGSAPARRLRQIASLEAKRARRTALSTTADVPPPVDAVDPHGVSNTGTPAPRVKV